MLLELLEVPQLLDACARGGAIDEALDLRAFVARAAMLHPDLQAWPGLRLKFAAAYMSWLGGGVRLGSCFALHGHV